MTTDKKNEQPKNIEDMFREMPPTGELVERQEKLAVVHCSLGVTYTKLYLGKAITSYQEAIKINPNCAEAYNGLGDVYMHKWLLKKAVEEGLESRPKTAEVRRYLRTVYADERELVDKAIKQFKKAIKINPSYSIAHHGLGSAYSAKGNQKKAATHYIKALQLAQSRLAGAT